ncbi:hypothetical protein C0416_03785 [bacterium]|nr:hypothetical protein [bacterium]
MLDSYTIIGFIGALVIMVGFLMNHLGKWNADDFEYDFINFIGASVLAVYAWQIGSYPFLVLFIVWALFSAKDVVWEGYVNMKKRKDEKEITKEIKQELEKEEK